MNPLQKGMLATFFGVVFGSLVSLAIWQMWTLGALVGGVITAGISAYIFFDIKKVLLAVPQAWEKARGWRPSDELKNELKKGIKVFLKGIKIFLKAIGAIIAGMTMWLALLFFLMPELTQKHYAEGFVSVIFGPYLLYSLSFIFILYNNSAMGRKTLDGMRDLNKALWQSSPIAILILVLDIFKGIAWLATTGIPWIWQTALPTTGRFLKELYIAVHCRDRMMCLVESSVGMIAAYLVQWQFIGGEQLLSVTSILVGGIIGTAFFFFNREVVAIKWLKVQPNGHQA